MQRIPKDSSWSIFLLFHYVQKISLIDFNNVEIYLEIKSFFFRLTFTSSSFLFSKQNKALINSSVLHLSPFPLYLYQIP